jgi:hypothetical protein
MMILIMIFFLPTWKSFSLSTIMITVLLMIEAAIWSTFFFHACCSDDGRNPIHSAASGGNLSCLELLIANNADVNVQD